MKKLALIVCLLVSKMGFSQLVDYKPGVVASPMGNDIVKAGKEGAMFRNPYAKTTRNGAPDTLQKLNADHSIAFTQVFNFEQDENRIAIMIVQGKVYFFTSVYADKTGTLYLRILDNATGKVISDKQKVCALEGNAYFLNFYPSSSPDDTKLLIVSANQIPFKPESGTINVFEAATMKTLNSIALPVNYNGVITKTSNYFITDKGAVFFTIKTDTKDKEQIPRKEAFVFWDGKSTDFKYQEIAMDKKKIDNGFTSVKNGTFFYCGVFKDDHSSKENVPNKAGVFCVSVNMNDFKITRSDFNYFPDAIATKLSYKDAERNKELGDKRYRGTGLVETEDGYYLIENLMYIFSGDKGNYNVYREFLVSKFDATGKLEFVKDLPNNVSGHLSHFDYMLSKNNLYLFYCEHPANIEKYTIDNYDPDGLKTAENYTGPVAVCVKLDSKGNASRQQMFTNAAWCYVPGHGMVAADGNSIVIDELQDDRHRQSALIIK